MNKFSAKDRFIVSFSINILRSALSFITVLFLARILGPETYGNYAFLLGSFVAVKSLLGMGTQHAFQTFMSQKPRGGKFIFFYAGCQLVQFIIPIFVIGVLFPHNWISAIWVDQKIELILLAFVAVFMQQQAWQTMVQIGESIRLTRRVQYMNLSLSLLHLVTVLILWVSDLLSLSVLFLVISVEYLVAIGVGLKVLKVSKLDNEGFDLRKVFQKYLLYCSPLIVYSWLGFAHEFFDRWLLQNFGGSGEQALYEIGYRFSAVSLLAANSIINIFWKELAEACEALNFERMQILYTKISKFLLVFGSFISFYITFWSEEIILALLGSSYVDGAPVLALMMVFSIYAAQGQINGILLYASHKTKEKLFFGLLFVGISIPLSYYIQAPKDALIPGLSLGATGMGLKRVFLVVFEVYILTWWIRRSYGWKFDWVCHLGGLAGPMFFAWLTHQVGVVLIESTSIALPLAAVISFFLYLFTIGSMIWFFPSIVGGDRGQILSYIKHPVKKLNSLI